MVSYRILLVALLVGAAAAEEFGPFTKDFYKFLQTHRIRNEYALSSYDQYGSTGTFGGKAANEISLPITHHPVLFVHGNSDSALRFSDEAPGWDNTVRYFRARNYSLSELYGLTYGSRNLTHSLLKYSITCRNVVGIRRFIEAILSYTQTDKMDIIAHSMGVSLARKAVQGGVMHLTEEQCELGPSLSHKVDAFVAISGANYGMCLCLDPNTVNMPACSQEGFAPGTCGKAEATQASCAAAQNSCEKDDYASVLRQINQGPKEAQFVASLWSSSDIVLGIDNTAWGRQTSPVPASNYKFAYDHYDHAKTKTETYIDQYNLVTSHSRHGGRSWRIY
ncbi:hypothetical protein PRIPAC_75507 [Pristionchus pacificus]|uniref:Lipase n=1 Tax=Pristionchus pacificus TaxID=54126 RepID=A0A2A6C575_PRIPA|nr:hypothetical protein PRIPAC_75507 [Pristionchus pacificus]|eukprot:PDM73324.1 lipase [Pristionchus pacificus]